MAGIMVIGGGIAGTAAALALHKAGFEVTVYEAHPRTGEDIGAFLTLASNGMRALAQLDAAEPIAELGFPVTRMSVLDEAGAQLAAMPLGEHDHPLTRYRCLRRAELGAALQREVERRGIPIRHGARLAAVTESATEVTATFADGSSATGDLLVGADGLHSAVRSQLDPAASAPAYAGQSVFYGYTTDYPPRGEAPDRITMVRGSGAAFGYLVSPAGETFWFARVPGAPLTARELTGTTPAQWRDRLLPVLRPDRTPTAEIVAATGDRLMATNALHLSPGARWHGGGRTVLIGDAAHAASPATGQGASMALEDAVVLAKALRDADGTAAALECYERHRRPRAEQNMTVSAQLTASRSPERATPSGDDAPPPARDSARPAQRVDEELLRLLDWETELPVGGGPAPQ
ncbi:2-polyprenyl-6-methoxyphenol hydroxylase-like FAD-dependent oxidoreductase [Kitasatospora sp. MAA4]|uniref:FAD-dependent oxidoreductase n=1 Tax=Kitasatospora sp. MAA4 TaxID=3035093 RepID=UPI0024758928|nr:FAD-dependent oxidoreductase [Kitasatospora sp. MAA4]MDH6135505.1 2-polyprenyl-6-methoxyphenol hydroxylase-like FAD-dependent oxidoreductase [Kitasatospora sp. MAA4]